MATSSTGGILNDSAVKSTDRIDPRRCEDSYAGACIAQARQTATRLLAPAAADWSVGREQHHEGQNSTNENRTEWCSAKRAQGSMRVVRSHDAYLMFL